MARCGTNRGNEYHGCLCRCGVRETQVKERIDGYNCDRRSRRAQRLYEIRIGKNDCESDRRNLGCVKNGLREGVRGRRRETYEIPYKSNAPGEILCIFSNSLGACAVVQNVKIFASRASRAEFDFLYCCRPPSSSAARRPLSAFFSENSLCSSLGCQRERLQQCALSAFFE